MLEVEHLSKRYGGHLAVEDLSFTAADGCVYGLLGPNGAGKSTTMNIITGYLSPTAGTVRVAGHDILAEPKAAKACLGYLPEQPPLYTNMTVGEYLDFVAALKGIRGKVARAEEVRRQAQRTGVQDMERRLIRNLSKGYRQRVGLAAALLGEPPVLILDEPTVGLDPAQVIEVRELIRALGKAHTVILSSHILSEVQAVCDRVLILSHGRLAAEGTPAALSARLAGGSALHVTAQGTRDDVLAAAAGVEGLGELTVTAEKGGEVSFTAAVPAAPADGGPGADPRAALSAALAAAGCPVLTLAREDLSLEDIFLQVTEDAAPAGRDAAPEPKAAPPETEAADLDSEAAPAAAEAAAPETEAAPAETEADPADAPAAETDPDDAPPAPAADEPGKEA